jgi:hypothetical protein
MGLRIVGTTDATEASISATAGPTILRGLRTVALPFNSRGVSDFFTEWLLVSAVC